MKVLVTGASGFIAQHLALALIERGHKVVGQDLLPKPIQSRRLAWVVGDLASATAIPGIDCVVHLAAIPDVRFCEANPDQAVLCNTVMAFRVAQAYRGCRFVFTSSSAVYGDLPGAAETDPTEPISVYGRTKLAAEHLMRSVLGDRLTVIRLGNTIGPGCSGVVPDLLRKALSDSPSLEVIGDGKQQKAFLWIDDAVQALLRAIDADLPPVVNVGGAPAISIRRIAELVQDVAGTHKEVVYEPGPQPARGWLGDVSEEWMNTELAAMSRWRPSMDSEEAVRRTVLHYVNLFGQRPRRGPSNHPKDTTILVSRDKPIVEGHFPSHRHNDSDGGS